MRIYLSCLQSLRPHLIAAYHFWYPYFKRGIEEAGHEWVESSDVDWAESLTLNDPTELASWRDRTWSRVLKFIHTQHPSIDLFLGYLFPKMVEPSAIKEIQQLGIPCINFFCDNVREFRKVPSVYRPFDLHWVSEYGALNMYSAAKLKHMYAPMPVWVAPEQRTCTHPEVGKITFIGSPDILRQHLLGCTIALGIDIAIYGAKWRKNSPQQLAPRRNKTLTRLLLNQWHYFRERGLWAWLLKFESKIHPLHPTLIPPQHLMGEVAAEDYVRHVQQSTIMLGINRVPNFQRSIHTHRPVTYSRLRDIEAPMMGACYLTEWTPDVEHFYSLGEEIETYRSAEELAAKIKELLANPHKRQHMRCAAQRRALNDLSFPSTLNKIAGILGLSSKMKTISFLLTLLILT